ncbi:phosphodiesterase [Sediminitomix flava]|uniref:Phosphoesterase n=1 Tax=Sediminitomix flava TaxID=379075 RepID=A0A315Z875_SEDFL|nr:phosphodiesterase [Sediminitomix flava]PWJ39236.1 hypothetical protein BC781_106137 [Sediminitomix flava]
MKILFISDIHGGATALKKMLPIIEDENPEFIIMLGDALNHGPRNPLPEGYNPQEVADSLNSFKEKLIAVRGNCDSEVDQMLLDYPTMADYSWFCDRDKKMFLTHGHIYYEGNLPTLPKNSIIISGHTHIPVAKKESDYFFINPGSIALPKGGYPPSYAIYQNGHFDIISLEKEVLMSLDC